MESNTTPNLEVAKTESKGPSLASIDRSSLSVNASAGPIAQDVTDLSGLFYNFNVVLKHYNDVLRRTVKEHPGLTRKQQSLNMKVLTSVEQALNANMNSLRINPSAFGLTIISARLGSIKESLLVVSGRLDAEEINTDNLSLALGRLAWRQARHVLLASMYSTPTLAEVYEQISIREMVWALAPEIKVPERDREGEEWPEQLRYIEGDAICPICHLMLTEDLDDDLKHGLAAGTFSSPCCFQPFHTACLCTHLKQKHVRTDCPLCRVRWSKDWLVAIINTRISQWEDVEAAWKNRTNRL